jgi:hypothetical protein
MKTSYNMTRRRHEVRKEGIFEKMEAQSSSYEKQGHLQNVEIQQEDPSENYAPTLGWSLMLFLGGSIFLDDEQILFIDDVYL